MYCARNPSPGATGREGLSNVAVCRAALLKVTLVIFLGRPEWPGRGDLGDDGMVEFSARLQRLLRFVRRCFLLRRVEKDGGAVLLAIVRALPVDLCRIVHLPEGFEQLLVADLRWIKRYLNHFGVASCVCAHFAIRGIFLLTTGVAGNRVDHAGNPTKIGFDTPETTRAKRSHFRHIQLPSSSYSVDCTRS